MNLSLVYLGKKRQENQRLYKKYLENVKLIAVMIVQLLD